MAKKKSMADLVAGAHTLAKSNRRVHVPQAVQEAVDSAHDPDVSGAVESVIENATPEAIQKGIQAIQGSTGVSQDKKQELVVWFYSLYSINDIPQDYETRLAEAQDLQTIGSLSFVFMAYRLKLIRDERQWEDLTDAAGKQLYKKFEHWVEDNLVVAYSTVKTYILLVEAFGYKFSQLLEKPGQSTDLITPHNATPYVSLLRQAPDAAARKLVKSHAEKALMGKMSQREAREDAKELRSKITLTSNEPDREKTHSKTTTAQDPVYEVPLDEMPAEGPGHEYEVTIRRIIYELRKIHNEDDLLEILRLAKSKVPR